MEPRNVKALVLMAGVGGMCGLVGQEAATPSGHHAPQVHCTRSVEVRVPGAPRCGLHRSMILAARCGSFVVKENADTVFVVRRDDVKGIAHSARERIVALRDRGLGLSGGPMLSVSAINMRPIEDLVRSAGPLTGRNFGFSSYGYEPFLMTGGTLYAGIGNGMRLGMAGMNATRDFNGERFSGDTSVVPLNVHVHYFGLLVEKTFVRGRTDLVLGTTLGTGSIRAQFSDPTDYTEAWHGFEDYNYDHSVEARMGLIEVHGEWSYSIRPFIHAGVALTVPGFISLEGFSPFTNEFYSVNPGIRAKLVFGNLG